MTDIDAVAEAIVASMHEQCDFGHVGLIGMHLEWKKVAQAAIDALQLTPQWAHSCEAKGQHGPWYRGAYETRSEAGDRLAELNVMYPQTEDRRSIVSRLVSPWVEEQP
jgi:hypothetical protein